MGVSCKNDVIPLPPTLIYRNANYFRYPLRSASVASSGANPNSAAGSTLDLLEASQCHRHAPQAGADKVHLLREKTKIFHVIQRRQFQIGWAEKESGSSLPLVNISLRYFGPVMRRVVRSHGGSVPLSTVVHCYQAEADIVAAEEEEEEEREEAAEKVLFCPECRGNSRATASAH